MNNAITLRTIDLIPDKLSVKIPDQRGFILKVLKSFPIFQEDFISMPQSKFQDLINRHIDSYPETQSMDNVEKFMFLSKKIGIPYRRIERYYYSAFKSPKRLRRILANRVVSLTKKSLEELAKYGKIQGNYVYFDQETFKKLIDERIEKEFPKLSKRQALKKIAEEAGLSLNTVILYYYQYFKEEGIKNQRGVRLSIASKLTGLPIEKLSKYGKVTFNLRARAKKLAEQLNVSEETIILFWLRDAKSPSFSYINFGSFKKCCELANIDLKSIWPTVEIGLGKKFKHIPWVYQFDERLAELAGMFLLTKLRGGHIVLTNTNIKVHKLGLERFSFFNIDPQSLSLYLHIPPGILKTVDVNEIKQQWATELGVPLDRVTIITKGLHFTRKIAGQLVIYSIPEAYIFANLLKKIPEIISDAPKEIKYALLRGYTDIKGTISQSVIVLTIGKTFESAKFVSSLLEDLGFKNKIVVNRHRLIGEMNLEDEKTFSTRTLECHISSKLVNNKLQLNIFSYHNLTKNPYPVDYAVFKLVKDKTVVLEKKSDIYGETGSFTIDLPHTYSPSELVLQIEIYKVMQYQIRLTKSASIEFIEKVGLRNKDLLKKIKEAIDGRLLTNISYEILEIIRQNPGITANEIAKQLNRHIVYIRQRLSSLMKNGLVKTSGAKPYRYFVVPEAKISKVVDE